MTDDFYLDQPKLTQNRIDLSTILKSLGAGDSIAKLNEGVTQLLEHVQKDIDEARQNLTKNAKLREHLSKNNLVIDETTKEIYHSTSYEPIHIGLDRASILYEYMLGSPNLVELDNFFKVINKVIFNLHVLFTIIVGLCREGLSLERCSAAQYYKIVCHSPASLE